jgi:hypothetical protein
MSRMERTELRPSLQQYLAWFRINLYVVGGVAIVLAGLVVYSVLGLRASNEGLGFIAGFALAFMVVTFLWVAGTIATSNVVLEAGALTYRRFGVLRTRFEVPGDIRGLLAEKTATGTSVEFLIMRQGHRRIKLNGGFWETDKLSAIAAHAGVTDASDETLTPQQWNARVPGLIPWPSLHPTATGVILGLGIVVMVVGWIVLAAVVSGTPPFDK